MQFTITLQSVITFAAFVAAVIALVATFSKLVRWVDKQKKQDDEIEQLKQHHDDDIASIKAEQELLMYGVLACLKGLREQGCDGPVSEAIGRFEKYLNKKAHK